MTCPICSCSFEPRRGGRPQLYCKVKCRQRAHDATKLADFELELMVDALREMLGMRALYGRRV